MGTVEHNASIAEPDYVQFRDDGLVILTQAVFIANNRLQLAGTQSVLTTFLC